MKYGRLLAIVIIFFMLGCSKPFNIEGTKYYTEGNAFYAKGMYKEAISSYIKAVPIIKHPYLFFNLANAYYKDGKIGKAVLFYLKAERLLPRDRDIRRNLLLAKLNTIDKIKEEKISAFSKIFGHLYKLLTFNELLWSILIIYSMAFILLIPKILKYKNRLINVSFIIVSSLFLLLLLPALFKFYEEKIEKKAVALESSIDAWTAPDSNSDKAFTFHEGTIVNIVDERDQHYLITLPSGWSGWINKESLGIV